jgi:hypothetical protein
MPDPNRFAEGLAFGQQILEQRGKKRGQELLRSILSPEQFAFSQVPGGLGYLGGQERLSSAEEAERRKYQDLSPEHRELAKIVDIYGGGDIGQEVARGKGLLEQEEPEEPTVKEMMGRQEKQLLKMFEAGEFNAENYKENLSKFAQRRVEDMGMFPAEEKPEKGKTLSAKDQFIRRMIRSTPPSQADEVDRKTMLGYKWRMGAKKDEWLPPENMSAQDILTILLTGGMSEETPPDEPTTPEFYGATSIAELKGKLNSDPEITESMKTRMLKDARKAGLE